MEYIKIREFIDAAIGGMKEIDPFAYNSRFINIVKDLKKSEDKSMEETAILIRDIFTFWMKPDDEDGPFGPMWQGGGTRTMIPGDIPIDKLDLLDEISELDTPPAFSARICDLLWLRKKSYPHAIKAIENYMACIDCRVEENFITFISYLTRIAQISVRLGKGHPYRKRVYDKLWALLEYYISNTEKLESNYDPSDNIGEIICKYFPETNYRTFADLMMSGAKKRIYPQLQEKFYNLAAYSFKRCGDNTASKNAFRCLADSWHTDAMRWKTSTNYEGLQVAHRLEKAVHYYKLSGDGKKAEDTIIELKEANKKSIEQMQILEVRQDCTREVNQIMKAMQGKTGDEALNEFMTLKKLTPYTDILAIVKDRIAKPMIQDFASTRTIETEGNISSHSEGGIGEDEAVEQFSMSEYRDRQALEGAFLNIGRGVILSDQERKWEEFLARRVHESSFIPVERRGLFLRSLVAGMDGDFPIFLHLAIPQLENAFRHVVASQGGVVTSERDGIMQEIDLNQLLKNDDANPKSLIALFGQDLIWEYRALLVSKGGPNLRNRISHGLCDPHEFSPEISTYLLWLMLFTLSIGIVQKGAASSEASRPV